MARRQKPKNLQGQSSDSLWEDFNRVCDENHIGDHPDDWELVWPIYMAGYNRRHAEVMAAMA